MQFIMLYYLIYTCISHKLNSLRTKGRALLLIRPLYRLECRSRISVSHPWSTSNPGSLSMHCSHSSPKQHSLTPINVHYNHCLPLASTAHVAASSNHPFKAPVSNSALKGQLALCCSLYNSYPCNGQLLCANHCLCFGMFLMPCQPSSILSLFLCFGGGASFSACQIEIPGPLWRCHGTFMLFSPRWDVPPLSGFVVFCTLFLSHVATLDILTFK